ncbi:HAD family hydrolase [archaeon]|jgi:phosphoglycolate phosphatase|nr:HAD family hydrolase [archaeon]MBT7128560.1 HAD family hydrolase [archaeon]
MIKAVFLDFDGTISDSKGIAFLSLVRTFEEFGYKFSERRLLGLLGIKMGRMLRKLGIGVGKVREIRDRFYRRFTGAAAAGEIKTCVSLKPLWKMKEDGISLIVVSNSRTSFLLASIKSLGIEGLFDRIYGAEKFVSKDRMLRRLFRRMKIKSSEAVYVGDRFSDVEFAKKAGCVSVAVHNKCSWSTLERIRKAGPDYVVRDFYGLRKVVSKINNSVV